MSSYLEEDFYYCITGWMINENPTRVFRLHSVYEESNGEMYMYPMVDGIFVAASPGKNVDSNGFPSISCRIDQFRLASYSEIKEYITKVYSKTESDFRIYENKPWLRKLYKDMKESFTEELIFHQLLNSLKHFEKTDVYHSDERMLLNLLRSYYKCRILKK